MNNNNNSNSTIQQLDYTLLFIIFLMLCVSVISIYSAPATNENINPKHLAFMQFFWYFAGGIVITLVMLIDFDRFRYIAWYLYGLGIVLLLGLFVAPDSLAPDLHGAVSWYKVPVLGSFQPSEVMKIFLIIV